MTSPPSLPLFFMLPAAFVILSSPLLSSVLCVSVVQITRTTSGVTIHNQRAAAFCPAPPCSGPAPRPPSPGRGWPSRCPISHAAKLAQVRLMPPPGRRRRGPFPASNFANLRRLPPGASRSHVSSSRPCRASALRPSSRARSRGLVNRRSRWTPRRSRARRHVRRLLLSPRSAQRPVLVLRDPPLAQRQRVRMPDQVHVHVAASSQQFSPILRTPPAPGDLFKNPRALLQ